MKTIDQYIIRKFLVTFFFAIGIFIAIAIVWDIAEKIDDFIDSEATVGEIAFVYYLSFIPYIGIMLSPLFVFISVVYFTSRMAAQSEIVAILSSGVSFYRMLVPYFVAATLLAALILYANHFVFPIANKARLDFENTHLRSPYRNIERNIHMKLDENTYAYVERFRYQDSLGYKFTLERFDNKTLKSKLAAKRIEWNKEKGKWRLRHYVKKQFHSTGETIREGQEMDTTIIKLTPEDFGRKSDLVTAMTTPRLNAFIEEEAMKGSTNIGLYYVKKYQRTATPFTTFILTLIGVAMSSRKVQGGTGFHIAMGFLIAFSFIFFIRFSTTLSINAGFPPLLGVWTPNLLYLVLAAILIRYAPK